MAGAVFCQVGEAQHFLQFWEIAGARPNDLACDKGGAVYFSWQTGEGNSPQHADWECLTDSQKYEKR